MNQADPNLERIASALERIAGSLEHFEQLARAAQPSPRLTVRRPSTDGNVHPAVNLTGDRRLMVTVLNEGDAATEISTPTVQFGEITEVGGVIRRDGQPHDKGAVDPGQPVTVMFELHQSAAALLADSPLLLRLPHSPGRFPFGTVLEVQMRPIGLKDGRHGWEEVSSREVPADAAA